MCAHARPAAGAARVGASHAWAHMCELFELCEMCASACAKCQVLGVELAELECMSEGAHNKGKCNPASPAAERARHERRLRRQQQQAQQQQQQQDQEQAVRLSADPSGGLKGLMQLDMKGLYTAVHVAKSLAQLDNFRWGVAPVVPVDLVLENITARQDMWQSGLFWSVL